MDRYIWTSYIEGPRWASIGNALRKGVIVWKSAKFDITLDNLEVNKGFIRETTFFTISSSDKEVLEGFQRAVLKVLKDY